MFKSIFSIFLFCLCVTFSVEHVHAGNDQKQSAHLNLIDVLMKYGSGASTHPAINLAMIAGDVNAVKILVEHGVDVNTRTPVLNYFMSGIAQKTYMNQGQTVLEIAIERNDKQLVKYLLEKGANPHSERHVEIYIYSMKEHLGSHVVTEGKLVSPNKCTAVYEVIRSENLELLSTMIEGGANIDKICFVTDRNESLTPLQAAIRTNNKEIVAFLLSKGAKI